MMGSYKICPKCQLQQAISAPVCARCGRAFRTTAHMAPTPTGPTMVFDAQKAMYVSAQRAGLVFAVLWSMLAMGCFLMVLMATARLGVFAQRKTVVAKSEPAYQPYIEPSLGPDRPATQPVQSRIDYVEPQVAPRPTYRVMNSQPDAPAPTAFPSIVNHSAVQQQRPSFGGGGIR